MWITQLSQIPMATFEDLKRSLITDDGMGKEIKEAVLEELLSRVEDKYNEDL